MPRYGEDILGGAETHARLLAGDLARAGHAIEVLSTCARDPFTWRNEFPAGETIEDGVRVRRFPVGPRDHHRWAELHTSIALGEDLSYLEQLEWMGNSVWSPALIEASMDEARYDWLVPIPYLFGTTFWAAAARPERTAVIPCVHDEPYAKQDVVIDALTGARGLLVNTRTERVLIESIVAARGDTSSAIRVGRAPIVAVGYEVGPRPSEAEVDAFCGRYGLGAGYLLYAGRREDGKGVPRLFENYRAYRASAPSPRPLVLIGSGPVQTPQDLIPFVHDLGFIPEGSMGAAYAAAGVFIHPSRLESLGMVLLEAWAVGTPAAVDAYSPVLVEHCEVSGGGLWWGNASEFTEAVRTITEDAGVRDTLGRAGRAYVAETFTWPRVRSRLLGALEEWS